MESNCVGQGQDGTHPMPRIFLVIRAVIPVCHQKKRLNKTYLVHFVVKIIQQLEHH